MNRKRILLVIGVVVIAGAIAFNANVSLEQSTFSKLNLDSIEALAKGEDDGDCYCTTHCASGAVITCVTCPCTSGATYVECGGKRTSC